MVCPLLFPSLPAFGVSRPSDEAAYTTSRTTPSGRVAHGSTSAPSHDLEVKEDQAATTFPSGSFINRKLTTRGSDTMRKRHGFLTPISTPTRKKLAPQPSEGPMRGDQLRGLRGTEHSVQLIFQLGRCDEPCEPTVYFDLPSCHRRTNPAIPRPSSSAFFAKEMPKSRGRTSSVASSGHGAFLSSPRRATSARSESSQETKEAMGPWLEPRAGFPCFMLSMAPCPLW
jgi:hypothetical protein